MAKKRKGGKKQKKSINLKELALQGLIDLIVATVSVLLAKYLP